MSRFRNLEFEDSAEEQRGQQTPLQEEACLREAQAAFESGRFEQSLRNYARALEHNPHSAAAWLGQVQVLIELGEYQEARLWADKALEVLPREAELLAAKAVALGRGGDLKGAISFSDAAVEERGNTAYVWLARADVLLACKERRAEFCVDKALALAPVRWFYLWLASRMYAFHRQFARGLQLAQQALELAADRAVVWLQAAQCQVALGLIGAARSSCAHARQLDPDCAVGEVLRAVDGVGVGGWVKGIWRRWRCR